MRRLHPRHEAPVQGALHSHGCRSAHQRPAPPSASFPLEIACASVARLCRVLCGPVRPAPHPQPRSSAPHLLSILYDLTELENASRLKKGETERTPKKVANVQKWFVKLDKDFADLLAYY
eukprot:scaffold10348_cov125-Isochrysis_galbana.AAC.4